MLASLNSLARMKLALGAISKPSNQILVAAYLDSGAARSRGQLAGADSFRLPFP
jgi:hypothetical protein